MSRIAPACLLLLALAFAATASADRQTRSWSHWSFSERGAIMVFTLERSELIRLSGSSDPGWLVEEVRRTVRLNDDGNECRALRAQRIPSAKEVVRVRIEFECADPIEVPKIALTTFVELVSNPIHYAEFDFPLSPLGSALFGPGQYAVALTAAASPAGLLHTIVRYLWLGFEHILIGLDHVAFLMCMLLVSDRLRDRIAMITGFTVGHSITLSLSVLDLLRVDTAAVEALIGYTVALVAVEVFVREQAGRFAVGVLSAVVAGVGVWCVSRGEGLPVSTVSALAVLTPAYLVLSARSMSRARLHLGLTLMFGMIHGLGFAAVLKTLGLPPDQRGWALAGFNLGVEAGQLVLLGVFACCLWLVAHRLSARSGEAATRVAATLLCAVGVFWFVERSVY
jgi:hypothetical protein